MKSLFSVILISGLCCGLSHADAQVQVELECTVSGTRINGEKASKPFVERIQVERKEHPTTNKEGKVEKWTIRKAELISDGKKLEPTLVAATPEYAVVAYSNSIGSGYSRRLLVFTYLLDLKARGGCK